ncbi:MAG: serine--tRNA ligase, partial [Elusimicrobiota bacterium]|nr:serine--tRNA ligase [Elusimicrobiota bacterium]
MIDPKLLSAKAQEVKDKLASRSPKLIAEAQRIIELDAAYKKLLAEVEALRAQKNEVSKKIGFLRAKEGEQAAREAMDEANKIKDAMQKQEEQLAALKEQTTALLYALPNLPDDSVPPGKDAADNKLIKESAIPKPVFDFEVKDHHDIGEALGILDFATAAKLSGSRFALYKGDGAKLERVLAAFMLDLQTRRGYAEHQPPVIVNADILLGTGQLPKFKEDMYRIEGEEDQYLISTAEIPLTNLYRGQILKESDLPKNLTACTPCFRKEAGTYGKDARGLIRNHQFTKVELVKIVKPEDSMPALEQMVTDAEAVLEALNLPY